jgi:spermidine synthase
MLPFGLTLGFLFRCAARNYIGDGHSLAAAYAVESLGGIAGGVAATLFLKIGFQNFTAGLICSLAAIASAVPASRKSTGRFLRPTLAVAAAAWIICLWNASALDSLTTSWTHPDLEVSRDSPYSRITLERRNGQIVVFENDALLFHSEDVRAEEFTHLVALQHPDPVKVLVLGGGFEGILGKIRLHRPKSVDYVELNPVLLDLVQTRFPPEIRNSFKADGVRLYIDDPRRFLRGSPAYDLMLVAMPEPSSGQANRFYTLEFFRQCAAKLHPGGVLGFRMPWSENYMTRPMTDRLAAVYLAAKSAFNDVVVLPASDAIFLCSQNPLPRDTAVLETRIRYRNLKSSVVSPAYLRYVYTNNRFRQTTALIQASGSEMNTDSRPVCYRYTLMIWLAKFHPQLENLDSMALEFPVLRSIYIALVLVIAGSLILLSRKRWKVRRPVLMGIAGFSGMVLETVLLLYFQIKSGILFQDVGVLLTSFMIGLFTGSLVAGQPRIRMSRYAGNGILAGFFLLGGIIWLCINFDVGASLPAACSLLLATGFMVAAMFAYTGLREPGDQVGSVIPLYSADLIGGGLGSLMAGILLVPFAGLAFSAFLIMPVAAISTLLVLKKE